MERVEKVELIQKEIPELIELSKTYHLLDESTPDDGEKEAQLLTQLDMLKEEETLLDQSTNLHETPSVNKVEEAEVNTEKEEKVVKELRKIQKQNFITHCLLSAMIVLTVTWQLSEVSLILKIKDGLNHPLRSIGSMIGWIKRPPPGLNGKEVDLNDSAKQLKHQVEAMCLPKIKVPELPHMEMPCLDFINGED
ncbi:hypothetical protein K7X08_011309 [Anisodus acutangulus]|uniref:Uncharacterized protein n=1 Tax=Anisodus acutangulus TaxID=402998 RepID=A0A9Q1LZQ1_9SOLA|nr:hypothetical protein K7X08_011309 [Anisodus acutangulus]